MTSRRKKSGKGKPLALALAWACPRNDNETRFAHFTAALY